VNIGVNLLSVFLAALVSMVVGFVYYSPMVLGKPWMKEMGLSSENLKKAQKEMGKLYGLSFVLAMVSAYILSHVMAFSMNFYGYGAVMTGLTSGFWMWLGFVMPSQATDQIFGGKNWKLLAINTGYQLTSLLAMGLTLGYLY